MLYGKRTYLSIGAIVVSVILSMVETGGAVILSTGVTAGAVAFFGILAAYFRREATRH